MTEITTLKELYLDELKDLWSANDQMAKSLAKIGPQATNEKLSKLLTETPTGIERHTTLLKELIGAQGEELKKEHCKGMEGLVAEAIKHSIDDAPAEGPVRDAAIIAQYQRMTHYGITGFGTVAAFAKALGLNEDAGKLEAAVSEMHSADDLMSEVAETAVNAEAVEA